VADAAVWAADVVLSDGGTVHVRPIEPGDAIALQQFHARQPRESQYYRYFSAKAKLTDQEATRFSTVDLRDRGALVVEDGAEFIAWASYERLSGRNDADVAFHVDAWNARRGIATLLLEHLGSMAKAAGIERFTAEVLADNRAMLRVFGRSGRLKATSRAASSTSSGRSTTPQRFWSRCPSESNLPTPDQWRVSSCQSRSPSLERRPVTARSVVCCSRMRSRANRNWPSTP
jgi:GNAT superfamily N-acetyltransferase